MEDGNYISRQEHDEFCKRMEGEHSRQNRRIELLEESVKSIQDLTVCVHELAHDMKQMLEEQKAQGDHLDRLERDQGDRLEKLEREPGDTWQRIKAKALDTAVGLIAGALVMGAAVMVAQYIV